jgi:hypothetical protein
MTRSRLLPRSVSVTCGACFLALLALGCEPAPEAPPAASDAAPAGGGSAPGPAIVEVTAVDYAFGAPDTIPSGWTTFRMENVGQEHHLLLLYRLPDDRTFADFMSLALPFERLVNAVEEGEMTVQEVRARVREVLPYWVADLTPMGGPGLVASGMTAETTVRLSPGSYVMECYVKTADGRVHSPLGMVRPLTVTAERSPGEPPTADLEMTLADGEFSVDRELEAGILTIAVRFGGSPADVHLARVTEATDLPGLSHWMDLLAVGGLREPAPADFLGGAHAMPRGETSFFRVELGPGRYAWVSGPEGDRAMVRKFEVSPEGARRGAIEHETSAAGCQGQSGQNP